MEKKLLDELFKDATIENARKLFYSKDQIASVDSEHLARLYKTNAGTINFEFNVTESASNGIISEYPQPVGYYEFANDDSSDTQITLLNQYFTFFDNSNLEAELVFRSIQVNALSFHDDMIIGAVSTHAYHMALKNKDCNFTANGIKYDLFMTGDGEYPQCFLNEDYSRVTNINEPIVAYFLTDGKNSILPMVKFQGLYDSLLNKSLLTAYRRF